MWQVNRVVGEINPDYGRKKIYKSHFWASSVLKMHILAGMRREETQWYEGINVVRVSRAYPTGQTLADRDDATDREAGKC